MAMSGCVTLGLMKWRIKQEERFLLAFIGMKCSAEALATFEQAVALAPHPATYVSMGTILAKLGRFEEAVQAYEQALAVDTTYASAYTGLFEALSHLGRTQEAEQAKAAAKQLGDDE